LAPELLASRPVQVILSAIDSGKLAHALLLYGDDIAILDQLALYLSSKLLGLGQDVNVLHHPDVLTLGPSGKMRQIRIGKDAHEPNSVRALIHDVQMSPSQAMRKVAIVREIDRMNKASANALLKTLEEPPPDTTLLLLTTRPYDLLATIRSRCLNFRIPTGSVRIEDEQWRAWVASYRSWLDRLIGDKQFGREHPAHAVLPVYGLTARFSHILGRLDAEYWQANKAHLPDTLDSDQIDALKAGNLKMLRSRMFIEIEQATRDAAIDADMAGNTAAHTALAEVVKTLESCVGLLEVNFNADATLEHFLLASLKLWTRAAVAA